jgi:hypothetical protein
VKLEATRLRGVARHGFGELRLELAPRHGQARVTERVRVLDAAGPAHDVRLARVRVERRFERRPLDVARDAEREAHAPTHADRDGADHAAIDGVATLGRAEDPDPREQDRPIAQEHPRLPLRLRLR